MNELDKLLSSRPISLQEWAAVVYEASKGPDSGAEVSRGKDPLDQSQDAKLDGAAPPPGGFADPGFGGDPAMMDPALAGGAGGGGDPIAVGKKDIEADERNAITEPKVELGGGQDGVDLKPQIKMEPVDGDNGKPEGEAEKNNMMGKKEKPKK